MAYSCNCYIPAWKPVTVILYSGLCFCNALLCIITELSGDIIPWKRILEVYRALCIDYVRLSAVTGISSGATGDCNFFFQQSCCSWKSVEEWYILEQPFTDCWRRPVIAVFNSFFAISLEGSIGNTTFCPNALDGPLFYVGLLALLLFPQCVKQLDRKWKRVWGILAAVIVIYCMIPAVTYICNLGADEDYFKLSTMWMLALLIISAVFVLDGLLRRGWNINRKLLFITYGTLMLCFIGVNLGNADYRSRLNMIMFAKVLIYLTAWFVFFLCYQRIRNRKVLYSLFALILCSEIYFFIHPTMSTAEHLADGLKYVVDGEENQQMIDSIKADENDDFYRIYFRDMRMSDYNTEGILCDFDSMGYGGQNVKSGYVDFLNAIKSEPVNRPTWKRSNGFLSHYMIDSLASLKYAVLDKNEVPPHGFEKGQRVRQLYHL